MIVTDIKYNEIRILFVSAIDVTSEVETRYPHLGFAYIASYAKKVLPNLNLKFKVINKNFSSVLDDFEPHLVGVSCVSQNFLIAEEYARISEEKNIPVVFGGLHVTDLPKSLPKSAILGVIGEGEITFADFLSVYVENGFCVSQNDLANINGISYWDNKSQELIMTPPRLNLSDLDDLPMPDRELLNVEPVTYMFTSRGCPYTCSFCSSSRYWDKVRYFSAKYVADEIQLLYESYNVRFIRFFDDLFVAKRLRIQELIDELRKRELLGKIKYSCNVTSNLITDKSDKTIKLMSELGIVSVSFGFESGDDEMLVFLKGGFVTAEKNNNAINICKKHSMTVNGSFIIGSPKETREQVIKTYNFIKNSKIDNFDVYFLTPLPGTSVWEIAKDKGLVSDYDFDWSRLSVNAYRNPENAIFLSEKLTQEELIEFYKKFKRLRLLRSITRIWGHPLIKQLPRYLYARSKEYIIDKYIRQNR